MNIPNTVYQDLGEREEQPAPTSGLTATNIASADAPNEPRLVAAYQAGFAAFDPNDDRDEICVYPTAMEAQEFLRGWYDAEQFDGAHKA